MTCSYILFLFHANKELLTALVGVYDTMSVIVIIKFI